MQRPSRHVGPIPTHRVPCARSPPGLSPHLRELLAGLTNHTVSHLVIGHTPLHAVHSQSARILAPHISRCTSLLSLTIRLRHCSPQALEVLLRGAATCVSLQRLSILGGVGLADAQALGTGLAVFRRHSSAPAATSPGEETDTHAGAKPARLREGGIQWSWTPRTPPPHAPSRLPHLPAHCGAHGPSTAVAAALQPVHLEMELADLDEKCASVIFLRGLQVATRVMSATVRYGGCTVHAPSGTTRRALHKLADRVEVMLQQRRRQWAEEQGHAMSRSPCPSSPTNAQTSVLRACAAASAALEAASRSPSPRCPHSGQRYRGCQPQLPPQPRLPPSPPARAPAFMHFKPHTPCASPRPHQHHPTPKRQPRPQPVAAQALPPRSGGTRTSPQTPQRTPPPPPTHKQGRSGATSARLPRSGQLKSMPRANKPEIETDKAHQHQSRRASPSPSPETRRNRRRTAFFLQLRRDHREATPSVSPTATSSVQRQYSPARWLKDKPCTDAATSAVTPTHDARDARPFTPPLPPTDATATASPLQTTLSLSVHHSHSEPSPLPHVPDSLPSSAHCSAQDSPTNRRRRSLSGSSGRSSGCALAPRSPARCRSARPIVDDGSGASTRPVPHAPHTPRTKSPPPGCVTNERRCCFVCEPLLPTPSSRRMPHALAGDHEQNLTVRSASHSSAGLTPAREGSPQDDIHHHRCGDAEVHQVDSEVRGLLGPLTLERALSGARHALSPRSDQGTPTRSHPFRPRTPTSQGPEVASFPSPLMLVPCSTIFTEATMQFPHGPLSGDGSSTHTLGTAPPPPNHFSRTSEGHAVTACVPLSPAPPRSSHTPSEAVLCVNACVERINAALATHNAKAAMAAQQVVSHVESLNTALTSEVTAQMTDILVAVERLRVSERPAD